ncbi:hypothetical protein BS47DRAFT_732139 [Hydnum rufescens UP504]|uniref:SPIN90/Ldb17 leucine-rich domain-containing protein n=1 Tax=Hydnum rufescens UP504 TaxID=1448309 RepID=A0A9P6B1K6_9AGAM|nr:hypothetical protein BS47DRAFT_732139 [Hydnum rufescens UP504]
MDIGIVYHIESAQQFWSELGDILSLPKDATLHTLDGNLRNFITFCATHHERYLSTLAQLDHCCNLLLDSEFFTFHSERSCDTLLDDARSNTDPHLLFILYNVFLCYGHRHPSFFRSSKRWQPLIPLLMDHLLIQTTEISLEFIEGKLGLLAIEMLYEVCRVQNLSSAELRIFDDAYIDHLFDIVESTRSNEILNYSLIKFLVSLNEQFMVASVQNPSRDAKEHATATTGGLPTKKALTNRVLAILMRRLYSTKTFGENLIFMLNRADDSDEDLCVQLLILKMLYLLFTTPGAQEYFYTNDLRVLIDVFVRALNNLSEENESMRHTYLRVLHPLLNNTQLRTNPYKPLLVRHTLQSIISHAHIRDINPTTRRLVERCLSGEWCKAIPPSPVFDSSLSTYCRYRHSRTLSCC